MISLLRPFSYSCILCFFSQQFYGLFYHLIFRDISLKSQESFVLIFRYILFNIQWFFICLIFFRELSFEAVQFVFVYLFGYIFLSIHSFISLLLFVYFFICLISLSCLAVYLFIYFVLFVFVKLC